MRAFLFDVRGREIYGYFVYGEVRRAVLYSRTDALFTFLYGGVGQADQIVRDHTLIHVRFHFDGNAFKPV